MFNTLEEDRFCDLYCDTVNRDWENSMQEMISYSEAELGMSRKQLDGLAGKRSWLVQKMRETQINTARYGMLEKKLENKYTSTQIITALRSMKLLAVEGIGYQPAYKRTDLTDDLHSKFGFRTDYQIMKKSSVRSVIKQTKERSQ